jgi:uncharacterized protein (TIGR03643 family)
MKSTLGPAQIFHVIRLTWEDRTSFEAIEARTGWVESRGIAVTRHALKPVGFRLWRKRVGGRITQHRALLERGRKKLPASDAESD